MIYKTNVTKEDFKRAYSECPKVSWIMHSKDNFQKAIKYKTEQILEYRIDLDLEDSEEFDSNGSSIDIFETFKELYEDENDIESLEKWNKAWENAEGFEITEYAGDTIDDGLAVGAAAKKMFDEKLLNYNEKNKTNYKSHDFDHLTFGMAVAKTKEILKDASRFKYLYEAAFEFDENNLRTRCDILQLNGENHVSIYEVKATSKIKNEHFFDLAYQAYVLEKNGFIVDDMYLVHMNPEYIYGMKNSFEMKEEGDKISKKYTNLTFEEVIQDINENNLLQNFDNDNLKDLELERLFLIEEYFKDNKLLQITFKDAYKNLDKNHNIGLMIENLVKIFTLDSDEKILSFLNKQLCDTKMNYIKNEGWQYIANNPKKPAYCYHVMPWYDKERETIFSFTGSSSFSNATKAGIYYQTKKIYLDDIKNLDGPDMPVKINAKGETSSIFRPEHFRHFYVYKQFMKNHMVRPDEIIDINHIEQLEKVLSDYHEHENVYMYDFETVKWALPRFYYSKTYQQIPFQYSVDIIHDEFYDYNKPDTMYHYDFIGNERVDPRPKFIVRFIEDMILKHGKGIYVAYNKGFEKSVLKYLAVQFPKYAKPLIYIANNTIDLMDFFKGAKGNAKTGTEGREWFLIYHPEFHGSYSIKKTQPALDSSFSYKDLVINKGDKASQIFREYIQGLVADDIWENDIKPWMIKYCNRDTLAMVVILKQVELQLLNYKEHKGEKMNEKI